MGGIDGDAKSGLKVANAGSCLDLSGVAGTIGLAPGAAANVLSKTKLIDSGHTVTYDTAEDVYHLAGDHCDYVFARKVLRDGSKSGHYSCEMIEQGVYVATVAENLRRYTKREVAGAEAAREMMARLGHASTQETIDMLQSGVLDCAVTKEDVRRADVIFGHSIASIKGKTNKKSSVAANVVIAPRVTQKQQVLAVDIFFVKKLPFLLGVMSPLGLSQCVHLKDRGVQCISRAVRMFCDTASGRGFDCVKVRTDGEGAISAMIGELNNSGVAVEVAGPRQHVPIGDIFTSRTGRIFSQFKSLY